MSTIVHLQTILQYSREICTLRALGVLLRCQALTQGTSRISSGGAHQSVPRYFIAYSCSATTRGGCTHGGDAMHVALAVAHCHWHCHCHCQARPLCVTFFFAP